MQEGQISWRTWFVALAIGILSALCYVLLLLTPVNAQSGTAPVACNLPSGFSSDYWQNYLNSVSSNASGFAPTSTGNKVVLFKSTSNTTTNGFHVANQWYLLAVPSTGTMTINGSGANALTIDVPSASNRHWVKMRDNGTVQETTTGTNVRVLITADNVCGLTTSTVTLGSTASSYSWQRGFPPSMHSSQFYVPMEEHAPVQMCATNSSLAADDPACATQTSGGTSGGGISKAELQEVVSDWGTKGLAVLLTGFVSFLIVKQFRYRLS